MKGDGRLINIRHGDGKVQRLPRGRASQLVDSGRASFISNTLFKAAKAGVQVQEGMSDSDIKKAIREATKPEPKPKKETSSEDGQEKDSKKRRRRRGSRER